VAKRCEPDIVWWFRNFPRGACDPRGGIEERQEQEQLNLTGITGVARVARVFIDGPECQGW